MKKDNKNYVFLFFSLSMALSGCSTAEIAHNIFGAPYEVRYIGSKVFEVDKPNSYITYVGEEVDDAEFYIVKVKREFINRSREAVKSDINKWVDNVLQQCNNNPSLGKIRIRVFLEDRTKIAIATWEKKKGKTDLELFY